MTKTIRAEFHFHTIYSHDSLVRIPELLDACQKKGIDRIPITDHDAIAGALEAKELDPERVIVGEEIQTSEGEILGYYMTELVPHGLTPMQTVEALKKQGAVISIAHPFDDHRLAFYLSASFMEILPHIDGIEVFNARCLDPQYNEKAYAFAEEHGLLKFAGSDAHSLIELGRANLLLPEFHDADTLRLAMRSAKFTGGLSAAWVHLISTYSKAVKGLSHAEGETGGS